MGGCCAAYVTGRVSIVGIFLGLDAVFLMGGCRFLGDLGWFEKLDCFWNIWNYGEKLEVARKRVILIILWMCLVFQDWMWFCRWVVVGFLENLSWFEKLDCFWNVWDYGEKREVVGKRVFLISWWMWLFVNGWLSVFGKSELVLEN